MTPFFLVAGILVTIAAVILEFFSQKVEVFYWTLIVTPFVLIGWIVYVVTIYPGSQYQNYAHQDYSSDHYENEEMVTDVPESFSSCEDFMDHVFSNGYLKDEVSDLSSSAIYEAKLYSYNSVKGTSENSLKIPILY